MAVIGLQIFHRARIFECGFINETKEVLEINNVNKLNNLTYYEDDVILNTKVSVRFSLRVKERQNKRIRIILILISMYS